MRWSVVRLTPERKYCFGLGKHQQRFQWCLVTAVVASLSSFIIDLDISLGARPMKVQIGIEVLAIEALNSFRMQGGDVAVAQVFANHRAILGFH
jgi:hypothetical protein